MNSRKSYLTAALVGTALLAPMSARSQTAADWGYWGAYYGDNNYTGALNYIISSPLSGTRDFTDDVSFLGFGIESFRRTTDNFGVGFSFSWVHMGDEQDGTFTVDNAAITGRKATAIDVFPFLAMGRFLPKPRGTVNPYLGAGIGPMYESRQLQVGAFGSDDYGWQLALAGEAGVAIARGGDPGGFNLSVRYVAGVGSDSIPATSYISVNIGIITGF